MATTATGPTVRLFLSWTHRDARAKEDLVPRLTDQLALLSGVAVVWWEDSHLLCGEDLGDDIRHSIDGCDYGLLLLSPAYFRSSFIAEHELPRFIGPTADKKALPVILTRLAAFDGTRNYRGVEKRLVFSLCGKGFTQFSGRRDEFAEKLATEIRRRVLGLGGYRPL
jgi:hypothetical protein